MIGTAGGFMAWATARGIDAVDDLAISAALGVAAERLAAMCNRRLEPLPDAEETVVGNGEATVAIPDFAVITGVALDGCELAPTQYRALPLSGEPKTVLMMRNGARWPRESEIVVRGTLGYRSVVPADLTEAAYLLVAESLAANPAAPRKVTVGGVTVELGTPDMQDAITDIVRRHVRVF